MLPDALGFEIFEVGDESGARQLRGDRRGAPAHGHRPWRRLRRAGGDLASVATFTSVAPGGEVAMGQSNHTSFLRPVTEGTVHAEARRRHRGRTSWVWEVDFTDDRGRLCAMTRVTMAVRPAPG